MEVFVNLKIDKPTESVENEVIIPLKAENFIRLDGSNQIPYLWVDGDLNTFDPPEYGVSVLDNADRRTVYDFRGYDDVVISRMRVRDMAGEITINVYGVDEYYSRTYLGAFVTSGYNVWKTLTFPPIKVKYLIFTGGYVGFTNRTTEFEVYGKYVNLNLPPVNVPAKPVPLTNMMGTNTHIWYLFDIPQMTVPAGKKAMFERYNVVRVYADWNELEHQEGLYTFNPTNGGSWRLDTYLATVKDSGIQSILCLQVIPNWMRNEWPEGQRDRENRPNRYGSNPTNIWGYVEQARMGYQLAARYGTGAAFNLIDTITDIANLPVSANENDTYYLQEVLGNNNQTVNSKAFTWKDGEWQELVKVRVHQRWTNDVLNSVKIGENTLNIIECGNENNKNWKGKKGYQGPREHAANLSAFYDGHKGTMGPGVGVKNADPNMLVTTSGLAGLHYNYFMGIIYWCMEHRGFKEDGSVDLPFDFINFHSYRNTEGSEQHSGATRKGMAPEPSGFYNDILRLRQLAYQYLGDMPMILGETGYDWHPNSQQAPVPWGSYTIPQIQAMWMLRTALEAIRVGIDWVTFYEIVDDDGTSTTYQTSGMNEKTDQSPRLITKYFMQLRPIVNGFLYDGDKDVDPVRVIRLVKDNEEIYALWLPIEQSDTINYVLDSLPIHSSATLYTLTDTTVVSGTNLPLASSYTIECTEIPVFIKITK
ncbi:hypothetical protein [Parapedobacter indicus]|uniref:Cellulase (Glycosyl hydrolase family 5) n=1 Tax=Parapedobacter indicus TaxID=1477437 RepID=A0A1I3QWS6_9SPHI|nr:hypothetical protein [Parapedobacter indicus]PPL00245.1 hypothetical protein CLV26_109123 [Parapedobacter indicus]SFJ37597.1 hypothetical protein SAMN05444682_109123 [Parapedobacter indicus]